MTRQRKVFWAKSVVILSAVPIAVFAYSTGPDPGKCAVPGESTCAEIGCHTGTAVNGGSGSVTVAFPNGLTYTPGVKQHLVVTIADPSQRRWGFQLTARVAAGTGTQAGTFTSTDRFTLVMCASASLVNSQEMDFGTAQNCPASLPLTYIEHSIDGSSRFQPQSGTYEFDWTPPSTSPGSIAIYVAGNAANGDANNTGDRIYSRNYTLTPAAAGGGGNKPALAPGSIHNVSDQPGISAGSSVEIKGTNLSAIAPPGRTWRDSEVVNGKLPTSLDGTSVTINGKPAFVYYISPTQLNVIAPADTAVGPVDVVVTSNGAASDPVQGNLQTYSPAWFRYNGTWAVATRYPDGAIVGDPDRIPGAAPARPGDVLQLWGSGFGPTTPPIVNGQATAGNNPCNTNPAVTVGPAAAPVLSCIMSAGYAGVYQVAITVPDVDDGDQPVVATEGGVLSRSDITIFVKR
jgi:uncharacterized protein (TIGR03437 family)